MQRPIIKDKAAKAYVEYLEGELSRFTKSPYVNSYLSIRSLVEKGNKTISNMAQAEELDFDDDKFKGVEKFLSKQKDYYEQMDYFMAKMNPGERGSADKGIIKDEGVEQFLKGNV